MLSGIRLIRLTTTPGARSLRASSASSVDSIRQLPSLRSRRTKQYRGAQRACLDKNSPNHASFKAEGRSPEAVPWAYVTPDVLLASLKIPRHTLNSLFADLLDSGQALAKELESEKVASLYITLLPCVVRWTQRIFQAYVLCQYRVANTF